MKELIISVAIFSALIFIIPFIVFAGARNLHTIAADYSYSEAIESSKEYFSVYDAAAKKTFKIGAFDYVCGVVAAEEPTSFDIEALKAQAVAAFTNAVHHRLDNISGGNKSYNGADVSTDSSVCMAYLSKEDAEKKWGDKFESKWDKITSAVNAVAYKIMLYDGEPITAVFCSMSSGTTESSKDVWGTAKTYLVEVSSIGDTLSPGYKTTVSLSLKEFKETVKKKYGDAKFTGDPSKWIKKIKRSDAGGVISATVCGIKLKGTEIRSLFGLRSTNFTIKYENSNFTFTVKGNGHGVGMSQYGANYMAKQGYTYDEILKWYYPGVEIADYEWPS